MSDVTRRELRDIIAACRRHNADHGDFPDEEIELQLLEFLDADDVIALMQ